MTTHDIQPRDIDTTKHLWNAFDNWETEVSACYIVAFCQMKGTWVPFIYDEINSFYQSILGDPSDRFDFNYLRRPEWIQHNPEGTFSVTEDFIQRCFKSSPADRVG